MGLGKTYSADYLIDSNGNIGASGQVLISTATGIDWADGSAITGGPFLPLAGGTMTGNVRFNDTFKAEFGSSADFQINHDGTDSLVNNGTGNLTFRNSADNKNIIFQADNGSGGNAAYLTLDGSTTHAYFSNPGNVGIGLTSPDAPLHILKAAGGANIVTGLKLDPDDATADSGISIDFNASTTNTGASLVGSRIVGAREGGNASGFLALYTSPDASGSVPLERMRINSTGDVVVGGTSSNYKFGVTGGHMGVSNGGNVYVGGFGTDAVIGYMGNSSGVFTLRSDGNRNISIGSGTVNNSVFIKGSNGNVGIGTTDPEAALDVVVSNVSVTPNGDSSGVFRKNGHNYISILSGATNEGGVIFGNSADAADGYIAYKHGTGAADQAFAFGTANGERMRIDKDGNVGIGTTDPSYPLEVRSASPFVTTNSTGTGNSGFAMLVNAGSNGVGVIATDNGGSLTFDNGATGAAQSEKMRITSGGNVGIGTTNPGYKLTVDNDALNTNNPALYVKNPNSSTAAVIAEFVGDSDSIQIKNIGTGDYAIYNSQQSNGIALFDGSGGVEIRYAGTTTLESDSTGGIKVTGQLSATGDVVAYSSDERLKENIKPIESAVDKIKQLKGVTFDWNEKSEELGFEPTTKTNDVGVIAQDVEAVFPQLVQLAPFDIARGEDGNATSKSGEDYKTVNYARLTAVLIEAVKEQQQQIDELKKQIK